MKQQTFAMAVDQGAGFERFRRRTKREDFLDSMNAIVPWAALCAVIEPHYPKPGNGRPPIGLERMLRIHLLQHWFNLADNAVEEALYDIASLRRFVGIDLGLERVPDETTVLKFRHLLQEHDLGEQLFAEVGRVLQRSGFALKTGTIVDATLIGAPSSTKKADKARDPEIHHTKNGNQWYNGQEVAHRGGQPKRAGAQRCGDRCERARQAPAAKPAARSRATRLRRQRLCQPEGTDSRQSAQRAGLHQPANTQGRQPAR